MKDTRVPDRSRVGLSSISKGAKASYQAPKVLASYGKDELESALHPEGQSGGGCGCGCGGGILFP